MYLKVYITLVYFAEYTIGSFYNKTDIIRQWTEETLEGVQVPITMHPYVALITNVQYPDFKMFCGGSIISKRVILTAAHCLKRSNMAEHYPAKSFVVYLGSSDPGHGLKKDVCRVLIHDRFGSSFDHVSFDIGLLLLKSKIVKHRNLIETIEIAPHNRWRAPQNWFTVVGFGRPLWQEKPKPVLKAASLSYIPSEACAQSGMAVPHSMFCLTTRNWASTCYGDSGSSIVWKRYLVGVVSLSPIKYCTMNKMPSMYTDVVHFKPWVDKHVEELESSHQCE